MRNAYFPANYKSGSLVFKALFLESKKKIKAIIELTALTAFQNMFSKFNAALEIAPQGFCNKPASNE